MGKRNEQAYDDRREQILEAALDAFCEKGFSGTSMLDIASRAKASKETIYAWFGNKEKLFEAVIHASFNRALAGVRRETAADPRTFLTSVARAILTLANETRITRLMIVTLAEGARLETVLPILVERSMLGRTDFVARFRRWRSLGLMEFEQDPEQICSLFVGMAQGEWRDHLNLGIIRTITPEQIEAHARLATDMFLKAVAPRGKISR